MLDRGAAPRDAVFAKYSRKAMKLKRRTYSCDAKRRLKNALNFG
jgi:hypothetical protein